MKKIVYSTALKLAAVILLVASASITAQSMEFVGTIVVLILGSASTMFPAVLSSAGFLILLKK